MSYYSPDGTGNQPHVPTAAQLAQLATLHAATVAAEATWTAIVRPTGTANAAQQAYLDAAAAEKQYELYIYGGQKPGVYDEGNQSVT
jgi:hypothetical protein